MTKSSLLFFAILFCLSIYTASMFGIHFFIIPLVPAGEWAALGKVGVWVLGVIIGSRLSVGITNIFTAGMIAVFGTRRTAGDILREAFRKENW